MKPIQVKCSASAQLALEEITPLQGDLKTLSEDNFTKLRKSIIRYGITFPFFIWRSGKINYILDGTQRDRTLRRLKEAGYKIPPLPVDYIEAKDEKEARAKILLISSQYGEMTEDSLTEFLNDSGLKLEDLMGELRLPEIDLDALLKDVENGEEKKTAPTTHDVIVICRGQKEQKGLLSTLKKQGYKCRALSS